MSRFDGNMLVNGSLFFGSAGTNYDVTFYGDTSGRDMKWDAGTNGLMLDDNVGMYWGDGSDLLLHHDGSNSFITEQGTGALYVTASRTYFRDSANSNNHLIDLNANTVYLKHAGNTKLATTSTGVDITGAVSVTSHIYLPDNQIIMWGTGNDLRIYHDGSNSYIDDEGTGDLYLRFWGALRIAQNSNNELSILATSDAGVGLYYNGCLYSVTGNR